MDRLRPNEKQLEGSFVVIDKQVVADPVTLRIEELIEHNLIQLGIADAGWSKLFRDSSDGRYWELTYPQSGMQGGGPPLLRLLDADAARRKYGVP